MEININNYEIFIIDYLDNKLGPLETAQLLLFLENNPGLRDEFEDLKTLTVVPSAKDVFGFNDSLKQPADIDAVNLTEHNYTHYFIAATEGDLSSTGNKVLDSFLEKHPELLNEYNLFKACKLEPDSRIKFPHAESLKQQNKPVYLRYYFSLGIAASILLLISIFLRLTPENHNAINSAIRKSVEYQIPENDKPSVSEKEKTSKNIIPAKNGIEIKVKSNPAIKKRNQDSKPLDANEKETTAPIQKVNRKNFIMNTTQLISENKSKNFYSNLYDDIELSQELALAEKEDEEEVNTELYRPEKIKGVAAGRIINSVISSGEQFAQQIPESMNPWLIADLGVKGFNLLTNNNYSIDRRYSNKGRVEMLKINKVQKNQ